ncbi:hypothetical protein [Enterococcus sp. AZ163]|uniref:hypothetical protein n=1 Tax=Enterococcus sp. AZ163 TaxID=2774638 RepID=UPI003D2A7847
MIQKAKDRRSTVASFVFVIILVLATTDFSAMPTQFNSGAVVSGLGLMLGSLLRYFRLEDKRDGTKDEQESF